MVLARNIHLVIMRPSPGIHNKVGYFMQMFSIVLKRLLPSKIYERMLMNHYKL